MKTWKKKVIALLFGALLGLCSVLLTLGVANLQLQGNKAEMIVRQKELSGNHGLVVRGAESAGSSYNVPLSEDVRKYTELLCLENGIAPEVLYAMMAISSNYETTHTSPSGQIGLLQLKTEYAEAHGATNLYDPYQNISVGVEVLSEYMTKYPDDLSKALMAFDFRDEEADVEDFWAIGIDSTGFVDDVLDLLSVIRGEEEI